MSNYKYLDKVNFPSDIKKLSIEELKIFSAEVRKELIEAVDQDTNKIHEAADVLYHLIIQKEKNAIKIEIP